MNAELIELIPTLPLIQNPEEMNESTRLEQDLRLFGFQAQAFLYRYSERFDVDTSKFHVYGFFMKDTSLNRIYRHYFKRKKNILTLGDLQSAIKYKKLNSSVLKHIVENEPPKPPRKKIKLKTSFQYKPEEVFTYGLVCIAMTVVLGFVAFYF